MGQSSPTNRSVHFGTFDLDLHSGELRRHGLRVRLPNQSFQILSRLLERPGEVVSREELRKALWSDDTFVDFEVGLSSAVKKLRDALGDSAENARFVETIPRRGYRFISPVIRAEDRAMVGGPVIVDSAEVQRTDQVIADSTSEPVAKRHRSSRRVSTVVAIFLLMVAAVAIVSFAAMNRRLAADAKPAPIRSIAVLPLANLTDDPGQESFVDGMTDDLITELAQLTDVRVISRTSVMQYKEVRKRASLVGQELNVDAIVDGTFVRSGNRVRINAQLIDAHSDRHLWAKPYERDANDIVALQSDVARAIAEAIAGKVASGRQRPVASRQISEEAYALLFKGTMSAGRGGYQGFQDAIHYGAAAIIKQPDFAAAYAANAVWYNQFAFTGPLPPKEFMPKAEEAARKALELDEATSLAHAALGLVLYRFYWDWEAAEKHFRRALEINPSFADGHRMLGVLLSLSGRASAALAEAQEASRLDPRSAQALFNLGTAHMDAGQVEQAISDFRMVIEKSPSLGRAHAELGQAYLAHGDSSTGIKELRTAIAGSGSNLRTLAYLGYADAVTGNKTEARKIWRDLDVLSLKQFVSPVDRAGIQVGLGEREAALASLDKACEERDPQLSRLLVDRRFDALRSDTRFRALEQRVGLRH